MSNKRIVCKSHAGASLEISHTFPFFLYDIEGIFEARNTITTSKGYAQDGVSSTGSTADPRNIVLTVQIKNDYSRRRDELYDFFQPGTLGTLFYYEGTKARKIEYEVESVLHPTMGAVRISSISLLCAEPYFAALEETKTSLSTWRGNIEFPLEIHNPFEVATKVNALIKSIYNPTAIKMGVRVRFSASGEVVRPALINVLRHETLAIDTTMHNGDVIEIDTRATPKRATLISGGTTTNIINKIAYPPKWPILYPGENVFRYDAERGLPPLSVDIYHTQRYRGA